MFAYDSEAAGLNEVFSWGSIYVESKGTPAFWSPILKPQSDDNSAVPWLEREAEPYFISLWSPREQQAGKVPFGDAY